MRKILIGTGFWCDGRSANKAMRFFEDYWFLNTCHSEMKQIEVVNNARWPFFRPNITRDIPINNNLGHIADDSKRGSKLMGWSMSWIIPAMIAYSEDCDFVYKEQDCLAFGDWLPEIRQGDIAYGTSSTFPCEQSLFYIARDFIPTFASAYMSIPFPDYEALPEHKMVAAATNAGANIHKFTMPCGRDRPLPMWKDKPWYAQKFTEQELERLKQEGFI